MKMILTGHKRGVWDVSFSPVEQVLASCSGDLTIKLWNLVDGQVINTFSGHLSSIIKINWLSMGL
jgi:U3 small nucleolar RNA-associated protein 13